MQALYTETYKNLSLFLWHNNDHYGLPEYFLSYNFGQDFDRASVMVLAEIGTPAEAIRIAIEYFDALKERAE